MAVPDIIELKNLQNSFDDGVFTPETPADVENIAVNSDTLVTLGAIRKGDFQKLFFTILNIGANPLDIIFSQASPNDVVATDDPIPPPPDELSVEWFELPNGSLSVLANANNARKVTDKWAWVMIRYARTNAGQNTTLTLRIRGQ